MKRAIRSVLAGAALTAALAANATHPPSRMLEGAIESYTNLITLPSSAGGTVAVRDCRACAGVSLRATNATRYYIGSKTVSLQELSVYLRSGKRHPTTIFYTVADGNVSRVAAGK